MFEDLRVVLSERVVELVSGDLNRYPEQLHFDYIEQKLESTIIVHISGSFMRIAPENIFLTVGYNFFLFTISCTTFILLACTLMFLRMDFSELIIVGHLVALKLISFTTHIHFANNRSDVGEMIKILMKLQKGRIDYVSASTKSLMTFFNKYWAPLIWSSWGAYLITVPAYRYLVMSDAFTLPFPMWFPFKTDNIKGFFVAFIFQVLLVNCFCVQAITLIPGFLYVTACIINEFQILIDSLQSFHEDMIDEFEKQLGIKVCISSAKNMFALYRDPEFVNCLNKRLQQIVERHATILTFVDHLQAAAGIPLVLILGLGSFIVGFALCFLVSDYESFSNKVAIVIITVVNTFTVWLICFLGQKLTDAGEKVREELYFINWYDWPEPMKRSLRIMLARTLNPPTLRSAYFGITVNYETFASMLSSAYSFLNFLLAFKK